jgi:hypothetical protein
MIGERGHQTLGYLCLFISGHYAVASSHALPMALARGPPSWMSQSSVRVRPARQSEISMEPR